MNRQAQSHPQAYPACPVQRLIVFHQNFATKCQRKPFTENTPIEELYEQIFFYYHDPRVIPTNRNLVHSIEEEMKDAVQFVGLVTALYQLSGSLLVEDQRSSTDNDGAKDRTSEVYFEESTLVFVSLEYSNDIVAVAQIPRLDNHNQRAISCSGGNPLAVRKSIQQSHQLFCMLYGGGILKRISEIKDLSFMGIRKDLEVHYKDFLGNLSTSSSRVGCSVRCIVEAAPSPVPMLSGDHLFQATPVMLHNSGQQSFDSSIRALLDEFAASKAPVLGISSFVKGSLISTHLTLGEILRQTAGPKDIQSASLQPEHASLIMGYMSSYEMKMNQHASHNKMLESSARNALHGLKKFTLSLTNADTAEVFQPSLESNNISRPDQARCRFMKPPPPFMLSATDQAESFLLADGSRIWALSICLPLHMQQSEKTTEPMFVNSCVVLFSHESFSCLIYLAAQDDGGTPPPLFFDDLSRRLMTICDLSGRGHAGKETNEDIQTYDLINQGVRFTCWDKKGQDVIAINRLSGRFALFSDRQATLRNDRRKPSSPKRSLFSFSNSSGYSQSSTARQDAASYTPTPEWLVEGLDCRHRLGSLLPLDILLAFDDVMNQVMQRRQSTSANDISPLEHCTNTKHGWIYAYAEGSRELYAFFDIGIYVTVSDVQSAAQIVRTEIFENWSL